MGNVVQLLGMSLPSDTESATDESEWCERTRYIQASLTSLRGIPYPGIYQVENARGILGVRYIVRH